MPFLQHSNLDYLKLETVQINLNVTENISLITYAAKDIITNTEQENNNLSNHDKNNLNKILLSINILIFQIFRNSF